MKTMDGYKVAALPLALGLAWFARSASAQTIPLENEGHSAGLQCSTSGVTDSGVAVGNCLPAGLSSAGNPYENINGLQTIFRRLTNALDCVADAIANNNVVVGDCEKADGTVTAVRYDAAHPADQPVVLSPASLLSVLGVMIDPGVSSSPTAYSLTGDILGQSMNAAQRETVTLWPRGSSAPVRVSDYADNCVGIDVTDTVAGTLPAALMNCPDSLGRMNAAVSKAPGLLSPYGKILLPKAPDSLYCKASGISNSENVVGTCFYATAATGGGLPAPVSKAVEWTSPTATPTIIQTAVASNGTATPNCTGDLINNQNTVAISCQGENRKNESFLITQNLTAIYRIPPITAGDGVIAEALSDNNRVVVEREGDNGETISGVFDPVSPARVTDAVFPGGALESELYVISPDGSFVGGVVEDGNHTNDAVVAHLPR